MARTFDEHETAEERRLWADYYEAIARAIEIMCAEGTKGRAIARILAQHEVAHDALERIKEIRGIR